MGLDDDIWFGDVLIGIAYYFPQDKRMYWNHERESFNNFFAEVQKDYPGLLGELVFYDKGHYNHCDDLDHAYNVLTMADMLISWGLDFNPHEFLKKCRINFELHKKDKFSPEGLARLKDLSLRFQNAFRVER